MSRTRREHLESSLLGESHMRVAMPECKTLALCFKDEESAVDLVEGLLIAAGMQDPEQLRAHFALPGHACLATPAPRIPSLPHAAEQASAFVLEQALWLGLCSAYLFDPSRPVVWTEASLRRSLMLCEPGGFYA